MIKRDQSRPRDALPDLGDHPVGVGPEPNGLSRHDPTQDSPEPSDSLDVLLSAHYSEADQVANTYEHTSSMFLDDGYTEVLAFFEVFE